MADLEWLHRWFASRSAELKKLGIEHKCFVVRTNTDNPATTVQLDSKSLIANISLWESGDCDFDSYDLSTSPEKPLFAHCEINSEKELDDFLSPLLFSTN
jgi:hypothetical protein